MIDRSRLQTINNLAVPIVGGMLSQNVFNLVDTAMVGVLGPTALAAVGIGTFANFMAISLVMGMSSAVQAMASRRKGEGRESEDAIPLNGGFLLTLVIGLPILIGLWLFAPVALPILNDDPAVVRESGPYFLARLCAVFAVGMNFAFRGYWNGVSLSAVYFRVLIVMHALNIVLNYLLIFGSFGFPEMGTLGAGVGTAIATYVGTGIYFVVAFRIARSNGFLRGIPDPATMKTMSGLAIPAALQQFLFAAGVTALFWIIGQIGTNEVAAGNVLVNLLLVAFLPGMGLGLAAASLVGQDLGRGDPKGAHRWAWDVTRVGIVVMAAIGIPAIIIPETLLAGFIHDPAVIALSRSSLVLIGATMVIEAFGLVLMNALLGAGAARQVMIVSVALQWLVGLPLSWLAGPYLGYGLFGVWVCQTGYRALQAGVFIWLWQTGSWRNIRV